MEPGHHWLMLLAAAVLPFAAAPLALYLARWRRGLVAWFAGGVGVVVFTALLTLAPAVVGGASVALDWPWMPSLGLEFSLRLNGLSLLFALLVVGIGLLIFVYTHYYLPADKPAARLYALLLLFMGSMLGIVLSGNLLLLLMFWELTSVSSFLLIGFETARPEARQAARTALIITAGGGLALLAGILMLGQMAGGYSVEQVLGAREVIQAHPLYVPALVLTLLGAFTKSGQVPFHFWLPEAMVAPTPVSAYLHSAAMVKAGVYLLALLFPVLSGTAWWFYLVVGTGLTTLLFAAYIALFKHDLKGLLAYSTVSHLGLVTLLLGFGTPLGAVAGIFHVINHAIFKASLFMAAGIIDHEAGTRDMRILNGLWRFMPYTATLAMISAAAMAGVPLFNGFLSKEMFFAETVHQQWLGALNWLLPLAATAAGAFAVAYSVRFIHDVFFNGSGEHLPKRPHEPPLWMKAPVGVLSTLCLVVGIFPEATVAPLLKGAVQAVLQAPPPEYSLRVWHGFTLPMTMSVLAMAGGVLIYAVRHRLFALHDLYLPEYSATGLFRRGTALLLAGAGAFTRTLDNGALHRYVAALLVTALVLGGSPILDGLVLTFPSLEEVGAGAGVTALLVASGALATAAMHRHRLVAVVALSLVGLGVVLAFAGLSAPDLALTQMAVEIVTTVLFLLVLYFLPQRTAVRASLRRRGLDAGLSLGVGAVAAVLAWEMLNQNGGSGLSDYFRAQSLPASGAENVVNAILVDFRGFDTLGEITVLAVAATATYAALYGLRLNLARADERGRSWSADPHPLVLAMTTRPLLPLAMMVAVYLFLRGHHLPGGGFVAGVITSAALILQYLASGVGWTRQRLRLEYFDVIGGGLLLAVLTGVGAMLGGLPFLTSGAAQLQVPGLGSVKLYSAMAFELGVFCVVVGTVVCILSWLGRLSLEQAGAVLPRQEAE